MIAVDTNVVVRLITGDEPDQLEKATCLVEQEGVWIGKTVVLETAWVLQHHYKATDEDIAESFLRLTQTQGILFESEAELLKALDLMKAGTEIEDSMHLTFTDATYLPFHTFDKDFSRRASRAGQPIQLIR